MSGKITHLKTLYVGSSAGDNTKSLSNGQMEIGGASYFVGAVALSSTLDVSGALTASSGLTVTGDVATDTLTVATSIVLSGNTLSGTELGYVDGITPGTVTASKAIVVDSNKDITGFRNVGVGGTLDITGTSTLNSAQKINRTVISGATYSVTSSDYLLGVTRTATGTCVITFPTAQITANRVWLIKDEGGGASTYNITIGTQGAETIDGAVTLTINVNYRMVMIYSNGINLFSNKHSFNWEDLK